MKIALIADVHGNLPALETVLSDAKAQGAEAVWNLGDFVGYGPFPEEVIQRIRTDGIPSIAGNYDLRVVQFPEKKAKWRKKKPADKFFALKWAYKHVSKESLGYLSGLPEQLRMTVEGVGVLLTHGSPAAIDEALGPDTPETRLAELAELARARLVACGHSHQSFVREAGGTLFVNPGGAGRPEGEDPRAAYALLDLEAGRARASLRRVEYDIDRCTREMRKYGFPKTFEDMVTLGKNLDEVGAVIAGKSETERLEAVLDLARTCNYEEEHTHQVTRLALQLFDELLPLHGLNGSSRFILHCGSLLHDIGWCERGKAHHKTAQRIILEAAGLPLLEEERIQAALVARYHRKALPKEGHPYFTDLNATSQWRVRVLAGILRVADGLDRGHAGAVRSLECKAGAKKIRVICQVAGSGELEVWGAARKADLLESALGRSLNFEMASIEEACAPEQHG